MTSDHEYFDQKFAMLNQANADRNNILAEKIDRFVKGLKVLADRQDRLTEENAVLKFEVRRLKEDINYLQGRETAANLILQGITQTEELETEEILRNKILRVFKAAKVKVECEHIISARRLGVVIPNKIRPVMIRLATPTLKKEIFPVAGLIREKYKISINNDYTPPQKRELFQIRATKRALTHRGIACHIKGFYIIIGENSYNWEAAQRYLQKAFRNPATPGDEIEDYLSDSSVVSTKRKADFSPQTQRGSRRNSRKTTEKVQSFVDNQSTSMDIGTRSPGPPGPQSLGLPGSQSSGLPTTQEDS